MTRKEKRRKSRPSCLIADVAEEAFRDVASRTFARLNDTQKDMFWNRIAKYATRTLQEHAAQALNANIPMGRSLKFMERIFISQALKYHNWNITHTAKQLGISRATLYNKIRLYELRGCHD